MACSGDSLYIITALVSIVWLSCCFILILPSVISSGTTKLICVADWLNSPFFIGFSSPGTVISTIRSRFCPVIVRVMPAFTSLLGVMLSKNAIGTVMSQVAVMPDAEESVTVPETVVMGTVTCSDLPSAATV